MICFILLFFVSFDIRHNEHIAFSHKSGYYSSEINLTIFGGNGNKIYYTLDGRKPTTEDFLFNQNNPISIDDATNCQNVYSARTDISPKSSETNGIFNYSAPNYKVDKCNIIRASVFDNDGNCLDSITGVYFIGFEDKQKYANIYTAAIVTDPDNLFDYDDGIYITGAAYDHYQNIPFPDIDNTYDTSSPSANYFLRGKGGERDAVITIFDNHQNPVLSQECGLRIKGGISRSFPQKSLRCNLKNHVDSGNGFRTSLFDTNYFPQNIVFFSGGNDIHFKLKDYLANTLEQNLHFATMDFIPCALFLDGEYWGIYYITEYYDDDYISTHYNVSRNNIVMVKVDKLKEGNEADMNLYYDMKEFISYNYMFLPENYEKACELIDIESFIDYYAAQIYIGRHADWPNSNYALWRTRDHENSPYGDCKWRWMLYDVNSGGLDSGALTEDTLEKTLNKDQMFFSLFQNDEFRVRFAQRILYIGREVYAPENYNPFLNTYTHNLRVPIMNSNLRFYMDTKSDSFDQNVDDTRTFLAERYDYIWDFLVCHMGEEWLAQNGIQK